jgi:hypothetical protein
MPGYDAFNDLVNAVDPLSLAAALNRWLIANSDLLPKTLAMDGKDLGGNPSHRLSRTAGRGEEDNRIDIKSLPFYCPFSAQSNAF